MHHAQCRLLIFLLIPAAALGCSRGWRAPAKITPHGPWYSQLDPDKYPFASREDTTITLFPSKATFEVPRKWLEWHDKFGDNLHLTRPEIEAVARGHGDFTTEYASVCNAALPFDRCSAHVGRFGWGSSGGPDLQVRVYDLEEEHAAESRIKDAGIADIKRFSGKDPEFKQADSTWRCILFSFHRSYGDYWGTAHVDFRIRQFENRTFVFVFMYAKEEYEAKEEIASILDSFEVP